MLKGTVLNIETLDTIASTTHLNPLSANFTKWSNKLNQFIDKLPTNCLSVFDHFVGLALKGLICNWNKAILLTYLKF